MQNSTRLIRWLVPSLPAMLGIALLLGLLGQPWRSMMVVSDADSLMWRRVGDWMIDHQQILRADVFSHTREGARYITKEWGANLIYAAAARLWDLYGLALVAAALIATTFALLLRQLLRNGNAPLPATVLTLAATAIASMHFMARPHLFSFLFLLLAHDIIRHGAGKRLILGLAGLALLWVNFHGGFMMLFFLVGAYWLGALLERDWPRLRQLSIAGLVSALATLANPNGWALHRHTAEFLGSPYMTGWIVEFASPDFHSAGARGLLLWLGLIFFTLALLRPKLKAGEMVALALWTYFALYSRRNTPLFVIISTPIIAPALSAWAVSAGRASLRSRPEPAPNGWLAVVAAIAIAVCWPRPISLPANDWPVAAVEYIKAHPAQFTGKMFNQYVWGSYLLEALPDQGALRDQRLASPNTKVFIDSRQDFYGESLIREFAAVTGLRPNWQEILNKYDVAWTLMPSHHRLNLALAALPGQWREAYRDNVATIYVRP